MSCWSLGSISLMAGLPRPREGPVVRPEGMMRSCSPSRQGDQCARSRPPSPACPALVTSAGPRSPASLQLCTRGTAHVAWEAPSSWVAWALVDTGQLHAVHMGSGSRGSPAFTSMPSPIALATPGFLDCFTWSTGEPQSHKAQPWSISTKGGPIPPANI